MNNICEKGKCTGCGACKSICPKGAIQMLENPVTGHFQPVIDEAICVDCGLCQKMCSNNDNEVFVEPKKAYAAWRKNALEQKGSSSGGVAAALYETAIDYGYYVVGTYRDDNFLPRMKVTKNVSDIESFKGSKYIQAKTETVYEDIRRLIAQGEKVLFVGTPCQCSAARKMIKSEAKLITVDLICHGVPSQKLFTDYVEWIQNRKKKKITEMSFRSSYGEEMTFKAGKKVIWKRRHQEDYYLAAFNTGLVINESCYQCRYAQRARAADLTIGDFWGIGKETPFKGSGRKVSVIAVNTDKGKELLQLCNSLELVERDYDEAVKGNTQLRHPAIMHKGREMFWKTYEEKGIEQAFRNTIYHEVTEKYIKNQIKRTPKELIKKIIKRK